jgi:hypothetical protein
VREAVEGLEKFSGDSGKYLVDLLRRLVIGDVEKANSIAELEYEPGTLPFLATEAYHSNQDVIETPPIARTGHFAYAILDLIQQLLCPICTHTEIDDLIKLSLSVARSSNHSFLRYKALELLFAIGGIESVGMSKIEKSLDQTLKEDLVPTNFRRAMSKRREVQKRGNDMANFRAQLLPITVDFPPPSQQVRSICN